MSRVLVLLMAIDVVVEVGDLFPEGCLYPPFIFNGGYKEGNQVNYNMITIRTLSLLAYFTYISMDIIIYDLENTS
jgi:hypothetical protein